MDRSDAISLLGMYRYAQIQVGHAQARCNLDPSEYAIQALADAERRVAEYHDKIVEALVTGKVPV